LFRQQQEQADKKARGSEGNEVEAGSPTLETESWASGPKKRKRAKDKEVLRGLKIHRTSIANESTKPTQSTSPISTLTNTTDFVTSKEEGQEAIMNKNPQKKPTTPSASAAPKGGLVSYGSDEDDEW
jgi:hypothetical protein